ATADAGLRPSRADPMSRVEIRRAAPDELRIVLDIAEAVFGEGPQPDEHAERFLSLLDPERVLCAADGESIVASAGAFEFPLSGPGGEGPAAGVTIVGVLPTHRRQGILTALMRRQLDDLHERGEPLAILWASEGGIYPRFGYGVAVLSASIDADRDRVLLRGS